jgi:L-ascorbate metabolism protein UlaG (beta-lactamase superfamily)
MGKRRRGRRRKWFTRVMTATAGLLVLPAAGVAWWLEAPPYQGPAGPHFDGHLFSNLAPGEPRNYFALLQGVSQPPGDPWPEWHQPPAFSPPSPQQQALRVTYVNHATVLVQINDVNILTDPVYADRVSPIPGIGPLRHQPPGIAFEDLPRVHVVVISHSHYDHCDVPTIKRLVARDNPLLLVGLGNRALLERAGVPAQRVLPLDWWQNYRYGRVNITFAPAQHWSARSLGDRRRTLWGSYFIQGVTHSAYFAGDTGAGPHFSLVRKRLGTPDVALLPIGAYEPREFMRPHHMNPEDAVRAHQQLGAVHSVGIHWGTFKLSQEGFRQPVRDLAVACQRNAVPLTQFRTLENGDSFEPH